MTDKVAFQKLVIGPRDGADSTSVLSATYSPGAGCVFETTYYYYKDFERFEDLPRICQSDATRQELEAYKREHPCIEVSAQ